jgi:hypothetical protein
VARRGHTIALQRPSRREAGGTPVITRYAALTRGQAGVIVGLVVLVMGWLLVSAVHPMSVSGRHGSNPASDGGDVALYKAVVARVRAGEGYYDVVGSELRGRNYPLRPAFTWRQPTYAWLLSRLPSPLLGNALLALIGLAIVLATRRWMAASDLRARVGVATALMVVSTASALVTDVVFMQEVWAGFLIALSVCLFALDRWRTAVAAGLSALAFREFALLPCVVGLALALHRRRWPEVTAWLMGLGVYGALMMWHVAEITRRFLPGDLVRSWVALSGGAFVVATSSWSPLLVALPSWVVALILPFVLLGLAGWRDRAALRVALIVFGYLTVFSFVGNTFNDYWGAIYAPLLPFGLMVAPDCVRDLAGALGEGHAAGPNRSVG